MFPSSADVTMELVRKGKVLDRVWVSDGAWTILDDSLAHGRSNVIDFENRDCSAVQPHGESDVILSGCGRIEAQVDRFAGVARHIAGGLAPLNLAGFSSATFWLKSAMPTWMCFEMNSRKGLAPLCRTLPSVPEGAWITVPLNQVRTTDDCKQSTFTDVSLVSFAVHASGPASLEVGSLSFNRDVPLKATRVLSDEPCLANQKVGSGVISVPSYVDTSALGTSVEAETSREGCAVQASRTNVPLDWVLLTLLMVWQLTRRRK